MRHRANRLQSSGAEDGRSQAFSCGVETDWLLARIAEKPDLTLRALAAELAERGVKVSYFAVWHFLRPREGDVQKKVCTRPSRTGRTWPGSASAGDGGRIDPRRLDPARLVFVDETWAKTNMTRTHGRCARGRRLVAKVPHGRWTTLTFIAALRCDQITAPFVIDGPINGDWLPGLDPRGPGPDPAAWRCGRPRQPRQPQGQGCPTRHPRRRRAPLLPAAL